MSFFLHNINQTFAKWGIHQCELVQRITLSQNMNSMRGLKKNIKSLEYANTRAGGAAQFDI